MRTAIGAVSSATIPPPIGWPRIVAADWLTWSFELPSSELVALEDRRQVGLVGDVEEDRHHAVDEPDEVELPDRQDAGRLGDRDRDEHQRPAEIADDEDPPPREPVDPDAGRQGEQQERQELDRRRAGRPRPADALRGARPR